MFDLDHFYKHIRNKSKAYLPLIITENRDGVLITAVEFDTRTMERTHPGETIELVIGPDDLDNWVPHHVFKEYE